jgi:hypothetical protein
MKLAHWDYSEVVSGSLVTNPAHLGAIFGMLKRLSATVSSAGAYAEAVPHRTRRVVPAGMTNAETEMPIAMDGLGDNQRLRRRRSASIRDGSASYRCGWSTR